MNEYYWHQRSRVKWLNHGVKNTKFFHAIAVNHKRSKAITRIKKEHGLKMRLVFKRTFLDLHNNFFDEVPSFNMEAMLHPIEVMVTQDMNDSLEVMRK